MPVAQWIGGSNPPGHTNMKKKYQFIISTGGRNPNKWRKTPFAEIEAHSCREAWAEFNSFDRGVPDGHWVKCMLDGKDVEPEPEEDLPRQYTAEEIRDQFINHMWDLVEYWDKHVSDQNMPIDRRLQGLMHSVLYYPGWMLDGSARFCARDHAS